MKRIVLSFCFAACASHPAVAPARAVIHDTETIASANGCEHYPSLSPDGGTLLYSAFLDGGWGIFRYDMRTHTRSRFTMQDAQVWEYSDSYDEFASVSPDGQRVAYIHRTTQGSELRVLPISGDAHADPIIVAGVSSTYNSTSVWTSNASILIANDHEDLAEYPSTAAATPTRVIKNDRRHFIEGVVALRGPARSSRARSTSAISIFGRSCGTAWAIRHGHPSSRAAKPFSARCLSPVWNEPRWSELYYVMGGALDSAHLALRPLDNRAPPATLIDGVTGGFSFSADHKTLVYSRCAEYSDIVRVDKQGQSTMLVPGTVHVINVQPRRFGDHRLVYTERHDGSSTVSAVDLRTHEVRVLVDKDSEQGAVSPDGKRMVYLAHPSAGEKGGLHIRTFSGAELGASGGSAAEDFLLLADPDAQRPEWSPDGTQIVFQHPRTPGSRSPRSLLAPAARCATSTPWARSSCS